MGMAQWPLWIPHWQQEHEEQEVKGRISELQWRVWPPQSELVQIKQNLSSRSPMPRYRELQKSRRLVISAEGQGRAWQGRAWQGRVGQCRTGPGQAGQGRAWWGRAGQGGQGRKGQERTVQDYTEVLYQNINLPHYIDPSVERASHLVI